MYVSELARNCAARSFDFGLTRNENVVKGRRSNYIHLVHKSMITQQNSEPIKIGVDTRRTDPEDPLSQEKGSVDFREYSLPHVRIVSFTRQSRSPSVESCVANNNMMKIEHDNIDSVTPRYVHNQDLGPHLACQHDSFQSDERKPLRRHLPITPNPTYYYPSKR